MWNLKKKKNTNEQTKQNWKFYVLEGKSAYQGDL